MATLNFDFDALTVGEIDTIEDELNTRLRPLLGDRIISFSDVVDQFKTGATPRFTIPQGKIMRVLALLQLRKENPAATWEDAAALEITVAAPKAETVVAGAVEAAKTPAPLVPPSPIGDVNVAG